MLVPQVGEQVKTRLEFARETEGTKDIAGEWKHGLRKHHQ